MWSRTWSRAQFADQVAAGWPLQGGDLGAQRLGDLDGEGADAAGAAHDEDVLSGADPAGVPERLERGESRHRDDSRLHRRQRGRLEDQLLLGDRGELGEPAVAPAEDLVAGHQVADLGAGGLDYPGDLSAGSPVAGAEQSDRGAGDVGPAGHQVPVVAGYGGGLDADQHLVRGRRGAGHVSDPQHLLRGAVALLDDGPHAVTPVWESTPSTSRRQASSLTPLRRSQAIIENSAMMAGASSTGDRVPS